MGCEIERKFLLRDMSWRAAARPPRRLVQGYFDGTRGYTLRVRDDDGVGKLTIKGRPTGFSRSEFEYTIPIGDVEAMLKEFCAPRIVEKLRYLVDFGGFTWEVDEYLGANIGLFTAEIELPSADTEFSKPPWLGGEISGIPCYTNAALSRMPFGLWSGRADETATALPDDLRH